MRAAATAAGRRPAPPAAATADPLALLCSASLQLRYANNSNYKNDTMIRKEAFVSQAVLNELKRIIEDSEVRSRGSGGMLRARPFC